MITPMETVAWLVAALKGQTLDAMPDWDEDEVSGDSVLDACTPDEAQECARDRTFTGVLPMRTYPVLDLQAKAATVRYPDKVDKRTGKVVREGAIKRTAYPKTRFKGRRIVIVLHQVGAERSSSNPRWHHITAHDTIKPDGTICELHPLDTRLVAANALDRAPWAGLSIEVGGNFEGTDGKGDWYAPLKFGRGRASDEQIQATRQCVGMICEQVAALGFSVEGIVPHRVAGRDKNGKPNRYLCPGSRIWTQVGEWAGAELGLAIPGPTFKVAGTTVPPTWRGPYYASCRRFL